MSSARALLVSLAICGAAAALEGLCAGKNVKAFFATLRLPRYSAPLWVWTIIGVAYYLIFFFITYLEGSHCAEAQDGCDAVA
jgi:tryptophan-rich sensory protein